MINVKIEYNGMEYLFDSKISIKAKGVMAMMVAYANKNSKKVFVLDDVREFCCDGKTAFSNAVKELIDHGYVSMTKTGNGFAGSPWEFILKE